VNALLHGYAHNPFEAQAYDLQSQFDRAEDVVGPPAIVATHAEQARELVVDIFRQNRVIMGG
jgi:hypothetical protein